MSLARLSSIGRRWWPRSCNGDIWLGTLRCRRGWSWCIGPGNWNRICGRSSVGGRGGWVINSRLGKLRCLWGPILTLRMIRSRASCNLMRFAHGWRFLRRSGFLSILQFRAKSKSIYFLFPRALLYHWQDSCSSLSSERFCKRIYPRLLAWFQTQLHRSQHLCRWFRVSFSRSWRWVYSCTFLTNRSSCQFQRLIKWFPFVMW